MSERNKVIKGLLKQGCKNNMYGELIGNACVNKPIGFYLYGTMVRFDDDKSSINISLKYKNINRVSLPEDTIIIETMDKKEIRIGGQGNSIDIEI